MTEKNQLLRWKADIESTCPRCNYTDDYRVYLNADVIFCNRCDLEYEVQLYASNVELKPI